MNGMSPLELYNHLMENHTKRPVSIEHIRAMRPLVFRRVLSKQLVFQMTIPGFGQVEYTPKANLVDKRGYSYDILPDPSDPREPALIYDGAIYIGEAILKSHTPFLDRTASGEIWTERLSEIKKAGEPIRAAKERVKNTGVILDTAEEGLSDLLQSSLLNALKLPEKQTEPDDHIRIQEDGSILNTQTGEITKRNTRPIFLETTIDKEAEEREQKLKKLEEKFENERLMRWKNGN